MRTTCAMVISTVILGASCFSCSNSPETGDGDASGAEDSGTGYVDSGSGTVDSGSTSVTPSDGGGGPGDAARPLDEASAGEASPGGQDAAVGVDAAVGEGGLINDGGAGEGSSEAGAAGPVAGTVSIFDGVDLNGWEQAGKLWSVVDGVIDGKGTTGGQLLATDVDYGDFRVLVSSNLVAAGGTGHLGICFWGGRTPIGQYNNCKLIIPPSGYVWDYSEGAGKGAPEVTTLGKPTTNPTWNTTEILCWIKKSFCRVAINGTAVLTYQATTAQDLKSIQAGPIGLQIHDGTNEEVQYRDVFVDPAPTVDMLLTVK